MNWKWNKPYFICLFPCTYLRVLSGSAWSITIYIGERNKGGTFTYFLSLIHWVIMMFNCGLVEFLFSLGKLTPVVFNRLARPRDISAPPDWLGGSREHAQHLVDRGQNAAKHSTVPGQPHTTKNYLSKMLIVLRWRNSAFQRILYPSKSFISSGSFRHCCFSSSQHPTAQRNYRLPDWPLHCLIFHGGRAEEQRQQVKPQLWSESKLDLGSWAPFNSHMSSGDLWADRLSQKNNKELLPRSGSCSETQRDASCFQLCNNLTSPLGIKDYQAE